MGCSLDIVNAARMTLMKHSEEFGPKEEKLLKFLILNSHTSPLEMTEFKFLVECPIQTARHWMRHRTWSYEEVSRRHTSEDIRIYNPDGSVAFDECYQKCLETYYHLLEKGVSKEEARGVLPLNLMTTFMAKVDGNNLVKFVILRAAKEAQKEIQEYARAIVELTRPFIGEVWEVLKFLDK
jgi:thymidylate synthase (FAD)